jgi:nucleoside-diphosphate-sugar epimerase
LLKKNEMKAILVAGAGGYIGIELCAQLLARGYSVIALDRYYFGLERVYKSLKGGNVKVVVGDIRYFDHRILHGVDLVVDLAGLSNDASVALSRDLTRKVNVEGGMALALAAKRAGVMRYVYASSASVYGRGGRTNLTEEDECWPFGLYAESKWRMEKFLLELNSSEFQTVVLRFSTVFGLAPRMRFDLVVNLMTLHAWNRAIINIIGNGEQWRPFVHVSDAARGAVLAVEETDAIGGNVFNVGGDDMNFQIRSLPTIVRNSFPGAKIRYSTGESDPRSYHLSFAKVRDRLGFVPTRRIEDGVSEVKGALEQGLLNPRDPRSFTANWYRSLLGGEDEIGLRCGFIAAPKIGAPPLSGDLKPAVADFCG